MSQTPTCERLQMAELETEAKQWQKNAQEYLEGFRKEISREVTSRSKRVVEAAKRQTGYQCVVCGFDFGEFYGSHGAGCAEGHHKDAISAYKAPRAVTVDDIETVCANCL